MPQTRLCGKREYANERYDSKWVFAKIAEYERNNWDINCLMRIIPVNFSQYHKEMLQSAKAILEDKRNIIAIALKFDKLLISLRTAIAEEYDLKKEGHTQYHDLLDAFRLSLNAYRRKN
jgi:hypothetical protein